MDEKKARYVGIDVSKETLDICVLPEEKSWTERNEDFGGLCRKLQELAPDLIVLEATGGHELGLLRALVENGLPVSREHAYKIHHHAKGSGQQAKTDRIDARVIADYGRCHAERIGVVTEIDEAEEAFRQLTSRREDLVKMRAQEKNRLQSPGKSEAIQSSSQRMIEALSEEIGRVEAAMRGLLRESPAQQEKQALLQTMVGVGETTSWVLLAYLPELGTADRRQISALSGVVPYKNRSGKGKKGEHIRGGRPSVRKALYLSALSAIKNDPEFKAHYQRVRQSSGKGKVAVVACMHRMVRLLNAMIRKREPYCRPEAM